MILANIKKGNTTIFVMGSSCPKQVTPPSGPMFMGSICLHHDALCVKLLTIVNVTNGDWGVLFWQREMV